jgi:hypothetical protein
VAHQDGASAWVQVAFVQGERLADAQPGAPRHDDQATQPHGVRIVACGAHDRDDLLDRRRISRIPQALIAWRTALVEVRQRGGRPTTTTDV